MIREDEIVLLPTRMYLFTVASEVFLVRAPKSMKPFQSDGTSGSRRVWPVGAASKMIMSCPTISK